jgi:hypothetical protein
VVRRVAALDIRIGMGSDCEITDEDITQSNTKELCNLPYLIILQEIFFFHREHLGMKACQKLGVRHATPSRAFVVFTVNNERVHQSEIKQAEESLPYVALLEYEDMAVHVSDNLRLVVLLKVNSI